MPLPTGARLGPYEIVAPLGAGGMGEVYRARDARLQRDVAIKGLPTEFARHPERLARFEREARLLASLSHPNVAAIFGLEEADGTPWLVLELIEGETLAQQLARGPLPVRDAIELGMQIAAGVEAAHERGIVHRDLKPGNVMITASRVAKVLDFGLAKDGAAEAASGPASSVSPTMAISTTGMGVVLGTAPYMSPEQARGYAVDRRADVWAFGCVLFECLAGRQAFAGDTVSDVIARILEREPDWDTLPVAAPQRLRDLVRRCLTKDLESRPRDIGDLRRELAAIAQELSTGASGSSPAIASAPSLAVLYFEDLSADRGSEYFCAGITEDILTDLSKIKGLRVASRNAVARYRGTTVEIPKVAAELGVRAVLEGSVRRAGDRVRISAQLISAPDGFQLWAERFDRTLDDVFAVQEEIASAIAAALRVALSPAEVAAMAQDRPQDVKAYDLYLKGRERYDLYTDASLREALELFRRATEIDPGYALAYAGIADCYGQLCQWGRDTDPAELTPLGLEAARRAIELDPKQPAGYKALALNLNFAGDRPGAVAALHRALECDPRFGPAMLNLTVQSFIDADLAGSERWARRALEVDPQESFAWVWVATTMVFTGREGEALEATRRARELNPSSFYVTGHHAGRGYVAWMRGDPEGVRAALRDGLADSARPEDMRCIEAAACLLEGRSDESRRRVRELAVTQGMGAFSLLALAGVAVRLGEAETAVAIMNRELLRRLAPTLVRLDPALHPLLDRAPFAPRRLDGVLTWPLEAPMIDAARFHLYREVRIGSGRPEGSATR